MTRAYRQAFTLVELLVVMSLMLVLASLAVMFVPRMNDQQRAARGAQLVQQWLITAQNQALRDRAPRGVRFFVDADLFCTEAQFIMEPDDFTGGTAGTLTDNAVSIVINIPETEITNGSGTPGEWLVQKGDFIELLGTGLVHRIHDDPTPNPGNVTLPLSPASPIAYKIAATPNYRIIRKPRVSGDEVLKLPDDIIIDFSAKSTFDTSFTPNTFDDGTGNQIPESIDILFGPGGNVIGSQMGLESLLFWVRDVTMELNEGEPSIIAVYGRTGAIEAHPLDLTGYQAPPATPLFTNDPYVYTRDGKSSGG